ncbi:MAG: hypothetical protein E7464_06705 [Ruminococcaceae bacterium]|nr:hypothetical protein [Oscillospiraceae bacterium]
MPSLQKKTAFSTELAYLLGLIAIAIGVAFMEKANFGVSMVVAPAYVLYRAVSPSLPFFTFGMAEYVLQAVLLIVLCILLGRIRLADLFSFVTAVLYGFMLDGAMLAVRSIPFDHIAMRLGGYAFGMVLCALGVSLVFHTYIAPEVYELFVKRLSEKYRIPIHRFKTCYDCISCLAALAMSFLFFGFGQFVGVQVGTIVCAVVNGTLIGLMSRGLEKHFDFVDRFPLRRFFETEKAIS